MSLRVILIVPRKLGKKPYIIQPPMGLAYLSATLLEAGYEVAIVDGNLHNYSPNQIAEKAKGYDIAGISAFSCDYRAAREIARELKGLPSPPVVILGGSHVSALPEEVMQETQWLDYAFVGEAERSFPKFLNLLETGSGHQELFADIPGLVYRVNDRIAVNAPQYLATEDMPAMPAWSIVNPNQYPLEPNGIFSRTKRVTALITGRGCTFNCTFCACRLLSGKIVRRRREADVIAEMKYLADNFAIQEFNFVDSDFVGDKVFARGLCQTLIAQGTPYWWSITSGVRLNTLNVEMIELMEQAGCYSMAIGIESGSDRILKAMNKKLTVREVREQVYLIKRHSKIRLTGFFIVGYPEEEVADGEATIHLAMTLPIDRANFFNFLPLPGTWIFDQLRAEGRLTKLNFDDLYIHDFPFEHPKLTRKQWQGLIRKANIKFHARFRILAGILREIHSWDQVVIVVRRALKILW